MWIQKRTGLHLRMRNTAAVRRGEQQSVAECLATMCEQAGLPFSSLFDMRHTEWFATVAERLGKAA